MTIAIIQTILPIFPEEESQETEVPAILNEKLKRSLHECEMICRHAGIKTGEITDIRVNPLLRSAWGRCITDRINGTHKIEINEALLDDSVPDLSLKRTIIHELCHTVKDGHGHRKGWREAADRLEAVYGLQLSPANSAEDLLVPSSLSQVPSVRYVFRCSDCGLIIERYRRSKFVDSPERYRCGNCGGTFEQL